jgi:hypothetical protein
MDGTRNPPDADSGTHEAKQTSVRATLLHFSRKTVEVRVARVALVPHARDTDLRLLEVLRGQS